ncbi:MAG: hypothetical protein KTR31_14925 [Myxococcales bacterium]|nr:hypothetical protein [Myxococcales bacterium]
MWLLAPWGLACGPGSPTDDTTRDRADELPSDLGIGWLRSVTITSPADVAALAGVTAIHGDLWVLDSSLRTLRLPDLQRVHGSVRIWENVQLQSIELPALTTVDEDLSLYDNPEVTGPLNVGPLGSVGGILSVNRMPGLTDLDGLQQIRSVRELYLFHDVNLQSLHGLNGLQIIEGTADLWELYALQRAELPALTEVGGKLDLFECDALTVLSAPALQQLRSYELHNCDAMTDLGAFPLVTQLQGELRIQYNTGLQRLAGFDALEGLAEGTVRFNPALTALSDLGQLNTLTGQLDVTNNRSLPQLDLQHLREARHLVVAGNEALTELQLPALQRAERIGVRDNPLLPHCEVQGVLDDIDVLEVECSGNLVDACSDWCDP